MLAQMLFGELMDFPPQVFSRTEEETQELTNLADMLEWPRYTSAEARSFVHDLLENDPQKRLGSPDSPHGLIRDHPFFKVGKRINWQEIEESVFKSSMRNQSVTLDSPPLPRRSPPVLIFQFR